MKTINFLKKASAFTLIFVFVHCAVIAQLDTTAIEKVMGIKGKSEPW